MIYDMQNQPTQQHPPTTDKCLDDIVKRICVIRDLVELHCRLITSVTTAALGAPSPSPADDPQPPALPGKIGAIHEALGSLQAWVEDIGEQAARLADLA